MKIETVNHVQICIPSGETAEKTAREFYCGLLGLTEIAKPESLRGRGGFWVLAGSFPVHVGVQDGVDFATTKAHVAYQVDDLEAWAARLRERGFTPLDGVPIPGYVRFECRDPFGNRFELIQPSRE